MRRSDVTPQNPSRRATKRVTNPLPAPTICPFCGGTDIQIAHHDQVYGRAYNDWPWLYLCGCCRAYVGMHPFTNIPLGTLADEALRKARRNCKQPFNALWESGRMTRDETYAALAAHLGMPLAACHFGWFNIEQCSLAREWAEGVLRGEST